MKWGGHYRLAYMCFGLSSFFRGLGKLLRGGKTIVVDPLTLPGWFVLDCCIIHQTNIKGGFEWEWWAMPDKWSKHMGKLK